METKIRLHNFHINNPGGKYDGPTILLAATHREDIFEKDDIEAAQNMCYFFDNVLFEKFDQNNRKKIQDINPEFFSSWRTVFRDTPKICHLAACSIAAHCELEYVLGFVIQSLPEQNISLSMLHSFNICPSKNCFVDFQLEAMMSSQNHEINQEDWDSISTYEGVVFPKAIVKSVFDFLNKQTGNPDMLTFLRHYVFKSSEKTEKFTHILKNNGEGWNMRDFAPA